MLSQRVELSIASVSGDFCAPLEANVLEDITGNTPAIKWNEIKNQWPHLKDIPFQNVAKRPQIDLLIGSHHPVFHQVRREVQGTRTNDPVARQTNLGWVCFGPTMVSNRPCKSRSHHSTRTYRSFNDDVKETNDLLRKFWELEAIGIKDGDSQTWTQDELAAMKIAEETRVAKDDRYEIGIPWKTGEPKFKNNFEMTHRRLQTLEKSLMNKGSEVATGYNKIIEDYVDKNYVRKVPLTNEEQWFLPHFPVIKDRTTTKVRIVYDAAAKDEGKCLNDAILSGPKLQQDLVDVLIRFRSAPVAISADISQMFLQVQLKEEDRPYHRFLWRNFDQSKPRLEIRHLPFVLNISYIPTHVHTPRHIRRLLIPWKTPCTWMTYSILVRQHKKPRIYDESFQTCLAELDLI